MHLDHAVQFAREKKSAELIRQRIDALPADVPVFLVGDFNAVARQNRAYDILTSDTEKPEKTKNSKTAMKASPTPGTRRANAATRMQTPSRASALY